MLARILRALTRRRRGFAWRRARRRTFATRATRTAAARSTATAGRLTDQRGNFDADFDGCAFVADVAKTLPTVPTT